jgi:acyl dehydratase
VSIDPDVVGAAIEPSEASWTQKDCILYALGVGAGATDPLSHQELQFTTENSEGVALRALPTLPVTLLVGQGDPFAALGPFNRAMLVHAEQSIILHRPVPIEGRVRGTRRITGVYDKGSGALATLESEVVDAVTGVQMWTTRMSAFIRGEGGWGGDRGPSGPSNVAPDRDPDHTVTYRTRPDQALLYRLSGDRNPLHSDPIFARAGGFDRPILHGLCTYGFTGRALLHSLCESDPSRLHSMGARFSKPVMPGEVLTISIWIVGEGEAVFRTSAADGSIVMDAGRCQFTD